MNQDNYMEEAFKMRNLLQEFLEKHGGVRTPTILGLREHIFTGRYHNMISCTAHLESHCGIHARIHFVLVAVFLLLHGLCQIRRTVLLLLGRGC